MQFEDNYMWVMILTGLAFIVPACILSFRVVLSAVGVRLTYKVQRAMDGYFYISTWIVGFLIFLAWPLFQSLYVSFHNVKITSSELKLTFIGWENYAEPFLEDIHFLPLFTKTVANLLTDLPIILVFSLFVSILVVQDLPGRGVFRMLLFMPVVIGSAIVIRRLFGEGVSTEAIGVSVQTLSEVVFTYLQGTIADWVLDLVNRVTLVLWRTGVQILIFVAGLHSIPLTMREAAKTDGASGWQIFWRITLPMLSPVILVNVVYTIVDSFTDNFNEVLTYIQTVGLTRDFRLGYAAALGWMYFASIFLFMALALVISSRFVFYAGER
jgi:ABC-type sugar transport system permease subunit